MTAAYRDRFLYVFINWVTEREGSLSVSFEVIMKSNRLTLSIFIWLLPLCGQAQMDTTISRNLDSVIVRSYQINDLGRLPSVQGTFLWSGKKSEVIRPGAMDAGIADRNPRQLFAKVPGVFVYDMDGTGNQINISARGLDPHRGWEFNNRVDGAITNTDMYGYPASHYSVPMEAVDEIQLVRGTGSLQYGAQFGGMLNYVLKRGDTTKAISFETINSAGSFGMLSTFNAIGGRVKKVTYYGYINQRISSGYRDNSSTDFGAQGFKMAIKATEHVQVRVSFGHSKYIYQLPGPLTDSMFHAAPTQSTRGRNYYNPDIYIPAIAIDWKMSRGTQLTFLLSAVLGSRNSVMFDKPATVRDAIDPASLQYAYRQVDIDHYNSYTAEWRIMHHYDWMGTTHSFSGGMQLMKNNLHRQQLGIGTTGTDFDLFLTQPGWGRDLHFDSRNIAFFAENKFRVSRRLSISPGLRVELGQSDMSGIIKYYNPADVPNSISHRFPLFGLNAQYAVSARSNFYGGFSQAYRPVIFKDIIPASLYEKSDKNLKDAYGYNLELGYRGKADRIHWDISLFQLLYNNRLGVLAEKDNLGNFYLLHTNIGTSRSRGLELFLEYDFPVSASCLVRLFTSTSFLNARYISGAVRSGDTNVNIAGNQVESAPPVISRNGMSVKFQHLSITLLYSYTGASYADALNTREPAPNGSVGIVPAYGILDLNATASISKRVMIRCSLNNVMNNSYFTKRPAFYPGPGIWSSDGRSASLSIGIKI